MHTHHYLLLATTLFATALASSFSTHSDYGQPWYDETKYTVWRRRRSHSLPCTHSAVNIGEACIDNGKLTSKLPPAIAYPTLGPQPYRGEKIPKDMRFYQFISKTGQSLGYWSLWTGGGDVAVGKEKGEGMEMEAKEEENKGQVEDTSGVDEKVAVDAREEVEKKGLEEEKKKKARGTIYHHYNTYFGPHVHKPVGSAPNASMEKAIDEEAKHMKDDELKVVDYKETKRIYESYVREKGAKEEAEIEKEKEKQEHK